MSTAPRGGNSMVSKVAFAAGIVASCSFAYPVASQVQSSYTFDLPAQTLAKSLRSVAVQTGANIVFSEDAVRGRPAPALHGLFSVDAAFRHLLQGSGLALNMTRGGSYVVGPLPTPPGAGPSEPKAGEGRTSGSITGHVMQVNGKGNIAGALVK